ncbi:hypothetical protein T484DRAFT_1781259 [Baffinella frigidus]|nr:hypothetical protein T484DRAFT_1781259 [Cryptophyta sp. CCMP2293]
MASPTPTQAFRNNLPRTRSSWPSRAGAPSPSTFALSSSVACSPQPPAIKTTAKLAWASWSNASSPTSPTTHLPAMCIIQQTDLLIERTRTALKLIAAMTEQERLAMLTQSAQRRPFALIDSPAHMDCTGLGVAASPSPRYRRPRQSRRLSQSTSLLSRLAAREALPPRASLLFTIHEVDESKYLDTTFHGSLSRAPSSSFAAACESSRKRCAPEPDTLPQVYTPMCLAARQMPVELLLATLTPDALPRKAVCGVR